MMWFFDHKNHNLRYFKLKLAENVLFGSNYRLNLVPFIGNIEFLEDFCPLKVKSVNEICGTAQCTQGRYITDSKFIACMVSKSMYLLNSMRNRTLKFVHL